MIELYMRFLGDYGARVVTFYRDYQVFFNTAIVMYGIVLSFAHRNIVRLEERLRSRTRLRDMHAVREAVEREPLSPEEITELRTSLSVPVLASHWHLGLYPVTQKHILRILQKKYPRSTAS